MQVPTSEHKGLMALPYLARSGPERDDGETFELDTVVGISRLNFDKISNNFHRPSDCPYRDPAFQSL